MHRWYVVAAAALMAPAAFAQAPVIETVENAASNVALTSIAPQVLITIRGHNLASFTETATGFPLPPSLGGATVSFAGGPFGGSVAQLLYASSTQINAQVPKGIEGTSLVVSVATKAGVFSSASYPIPAVTGKDSVPIAPMGVFTQDSSGCGQALAYNVHPDGSVTLNTPQTSFDPDKDVGLTVYLTGLGGLPFPDRQTGVPWRYNGSDNLAPKVPSSVTLGVPGLTGTAGGLNLAYLGPAPNQVGVDQANALGQLKTGLQGCKLPFSLAVLEPQITNNNLGIPGAPSPVSYLPFSSTQLVNVSIQPGGGQCVDPPSGAIGVMSWQKNVVSDPANSSSTEAITAQFIQADGLGFPQPPTGAPFPAPQLTTENSALYGPVPAPAAAAVCGASLPDTLDAGALAVSGPGLSSMALVPATQGGRLTYTAELTPGTLQGGMYRVSGQGGSQVGAFTVNANIPAPISAISTYAPGGLALLQPGRQFEYPCINISVHPIFPCGGVYGFAWTGGDNRSIVTVQFIVNGQFLATGSSYGGNGQIYIPESYGAYPAFCGTALNQGCVLMPSGDVEVIVTQTPYHGPSQPFSAPGLGGGGESTWKYVWDFRGLTNGSSALPAERQ